jgi:predicted SprT family Zn-dependent metalloprotease
MELDKAKLLAETLIKENGLVDYTFQFDSSLRRFGYCNNTRKIISLSEPLVLLNVEEQVKQTILHEIAHALTPGHNHDEVWKATAVRLGDTGERCYRNEEVTIPEAKHVYACSGCGFKYERIKRIKGYIHHYHPACGRVKGRLIKVK